MRISGTRAPNCRGWGSRWTGDDDRAARHRPPRPCRRGAAHPRGARGAAARRPVDRDARPGRAAAPGVGRAAHGMGQVRRVLRGHGVAAGGGARADGHRLAAPRADAQPDRRRRPRRCARGHGELGEHRRLGGHLRRDRRRRGRRPAGEPGAAEQPGLPGPGAAPAHGGRGPAGGGRGALRVGLGPRLPAGLPAAARADRRAAAGIPVLATTATANDRVVRDVTEQLGLLGEPLVLRGSLDRESLRLSVVRLPTPAQRLGWLAAHLAELPGAGIVYTLTVAAAEEVAEFLRERGFPSPPTPARPIRSERLAAEADLLANRVKALVATSALGMGFDKPDLGFVVHLGAPSSPVAYYQQIGRAGRGGRAGGGGAVARRGGPRHLGVLRLARVPARAARAADAGRAVGRRRCRRRRSRPRVDLSRTRLEMLLKVLDSDGAVRRVKGGWVATGLAVDLRRRAAPADRRRPARPSSGRCSPTWTRPSAGWCSCAGSSTTDAGEPCGRCDTCTGTVRSRGGRRGRGRRAGADRPARRAGAAAQAVAVGMAELGVPRRAASPPASSPTRAG